MFHNEGMITKLKKNGPNPAFFFYILILFKHKFNIKTEGVSRIQTRIVGVEGKHADNLTTNTVQLSQSYTWVHKARLSSYLGPNKVS